MPAFSFQAINLHPVTNPRVVGVLTEGDRVVHPASLAVVRHLAAVLHSPRASRERVPRDALAPRCCGGNAACKALGEKNGSILYMEYALKRMIYSN